LRRSLRLSVSSSIQVVSLSLSQHSLASASTSRCRAHAVRSLHMLPRKRDALKAVPPRARASRRRAPPLVSRASARRSLASVVVPWSLRCAPADQPGPGCARGFGPDRRARVVQDRRSWSQIAQVLAQIRCRSAAPGSCTAFEARGASRNIRTASRHASSAARGGQSARACFAPALAPGKRQSCGRRLAEWRAHTLLSRA